MSRYIDADDLISRIRATTAINVGVDDERNTLKNGLMLCEKLVELKCQSIDIDLADDGTLSVEVEDATKVKRVLVEDGESGDLYYADGRPQGEWIYMDEPIVGNPYGSYGCPECGHIEPFTSNYCPNCGAKMKGADDE